MMGELDQLIEAYQKDTPEKALIHLKGLLAQSYEAGRLRQKAYMENQVKLMSFKNHRTYVQTKDEQEQFNQPSKTEPDQAMTVTEIMEKHNAGHRIQRKGIQYEGQTLEELATRDGYEIDKMDKVERAHMAKVYQQKNNLTEQQLQQLNNEKIAKAAAGEVLKQQKADEVAKPQNEGGESET